MVRLNSSSQFCSGLADIEFSQNIRRGGFVAAAVGLAMCPWNLLKDGATFTSYLSAYSVFLSSIAGVMVRPFACTGPWPTLPDPLSEPRYQVTEYYFIRKGHYRVADLYDPSAKSWYHYFYGINLRAYAAYISGILINVVGFAGASE